MAFGEHLLKIVIIGSGYVGLVSAACFAKIGHNVICVDANPSVVSMINSGLSPIHEKGLPEILGEAVSSGSLKATNDLSSAIINADISMISVGTPFSNGSIDLNYITVAAEQLAKVLHMAAKYHVVCVKSTVIPGTTRDIVSPILTKYSNRELGVSLGVSMNPEFLSEGSAIDDFMQPDRIIIGAQDDLTVRLMSDLYSYFKDTDTIVTSLNSAEMIKYTSNALLATLISFSNEIANLSEDIDGVDAVDVLNAVHLDRRLSPLLLNERISPGILSFLYPGTGYGGSCFPKDTKALISYSKTMGHNMNLLRSVVETNVKQPSLTVGLARKELGKLDGKRVGILGLAFKPGTDDVRETPAKHIIELLIKENAQILAHDPIAIENMRENTHHLDVEYSDDLNYVTANVDIIILVTSWPEYKKLHQIPGVSDMPIIDGRRYLNPKNFKKYRGIGRSTSLDQKLEKL
tara:strand:+ start:389 stop:1774 length:1386 start_codon:yes stop_codon:yes gene_type:complete